MPRPENEKPPNVRKRIHEAIQSTNDTNEELEDSVLVGWVAVCEWSDPDGERWISKTSGSAGGEDSPTNWAVDGLLFHALNRWDED